MSSKYSVSDLRGLMSKVDVKKNIVFDHVHNNGKTTNRILMPVPTEKAVFKFLSAYYVTGRIDEGIFIGDYSESEASINNIEGGQGGIPLCDDTCGKFEVNLDFHWSNKEGDGEDMTKMRKEGTMGYNERYGKIYEETMGVSVDFAREVRSDNWTVKYGVEGEEVHEQFIRSSTARYVISKVFDSMQSLFEPHYWDEYLNEIPEM